MAKQLRFRLVYDDPTKPNQVYAEYSVKDFKTLLLSEWVKIQNAGDRVEVINRAFDRACGVFKLNAVSISPAEGI